MKFAYLTSKTQLLPTYPQLWFCLPKRHSRHLLLVSPLDMAGPTHQLTSSPARTTTSTISGRIPAGLGPCAARRRPQQAARRRPPAAGAPAHPPARRRPPAAGAPAPARPPPLSRSFPHRPIATRLGARPALSAFFMDAGSQTWPPPAPSPPPFSSRPRASSSPHCRRRHSKKQHKPPTAQPPLTPAPAPL